MPSRVPAADAAVGAPLRGLDALPPDGVVPRARWRGLAAVATMAVLSAAVGSSPDYLRLRVDQIAGSSTWSAIAWEARHLPAGLGLVMQQVVSPPARPDPLLAEYLRGGVQPSEIDRQALALSLASAVADRLRAGGVAMGAGSVIPPVSLALTDPPRSLVVSPRGEIRLAHWVLVEGALDAARVEEIERAVERLDHSALVVEIGGISTYPVLVPPDAPPAFVLETIAHEWTHTALFASALGRAYGSNPEARAINETTADVVAAEVAAAILEDVGPAPRSTNDQGRGAMLREALRRIRIGAEERLARGDVDGAEAYMETERRALVAQGYRIRRLNQAYFAFHGNYAEGPAASTEVVDAVRALRARSASLGDFLARVGEITSVADLQRAAGAVP